MPSPIIIKNTLVIGSAIAFNSAIFAALIKENEKMNRAIQHKQKLANQDKPK